MRRKDVLRNFGLLTEGYNTGDKISYVQLMYSNWYHIYNSQGSF